MIQSMTGYAAHSRDIGRGILHLELRSVNSRYLDIAFRITEELRFVEPGLRELVTSRLNRGKIEFRLSILPDAATPREPALNLAILRQLRVLDQSVREHMPSATPLTVAEVLRWPGVMGDEILPIEALQRESAALTAAALEEFIATRAREGKKLATMIMERINRMRALVVELAPKLPAAIADYQYRLATRLREALAGGEEERVRQEVAVFAAKVDVAEEVSRLSAHVDEVARVIEQGGAVGKRLDFLMQELNREANTLASKSVSTEVSGIALEFKLLIEQMREQVQNIE